MPGDLGLFMGQILRRPFEVVALAPSSTMLARRMAEPVELLSGRVAELGPGTGKITRELLAHGIAAADLTLFELNPVFCNRLRHDFPGVTVLEHPAQRLAKHCRPGLDAVVSGLPLLSMKDATQTAIVTGAFAVLRRSGVFVQFTYGARPPIAEPVRARLALEWTRSERVWGNLPPACVYAYRRASD